MQHSLHTRLRHTIVDGGIYTEEVEALGVQSVPTVYADGEMLSVGRTTVAELLDKLEEMVGVADWF